MWVQWVNLGNDASLGRCEKASGLTCLSVLLMNGGWENVSEIGVTILVFLTGTAGLRHEAPKWPHGAQEFLPGALTCQSNRNELGCKKETPEELPDSLGLMV